MKAPDVTHSTVTFVDFRAKRAVNTPANETRTGPTMQASPKVSVADRGDDVRASKRPASLTAVVTGVLEGHADSKLAYLEIIERDPRMQRLCAVLSEHASPGCLATLRFKSLPLILTSRGVRVRVDDQTLGTYAKRVSARDVAKLDLAALQNLVTLATSTYDAGHEVIERCVLVMTERDCRPMTPREKLDALRESEHELRAAGVLAIAAAYDMPSVRAHLTSAAWRLDDIFRSDYLALTSDGFRVANPRGKLRKVRLDDMPKLAAAEARRLVGAAYQLANGDKEWRYGRIGFAERLTKKLLPH